MITQAYSLSLTFMVFFLTIIEKNRIGKIITPFTLAAWPFVVISLFNNFILTTFFGFYDITARAHLFIMINLVILWIVGFILSFFLFNKENVKINTDFSHLFKEVSKYQLIFIIISWLVVFLNFYRAYSLIAQFGGYWILGDIQFERIMGTGPIAHMVQVGKVCFLLLVFTFKYAKSKSLYVVTLVGLFLAVALIQVKYHLMFLIIITFLYFNINKSIKDQLKGIFKISLILFLIMNMFWIFLTLIWGTFSFENKDVWEFFGKQFLNYFVSGPIVLDRWIGFGDIKPDWTLFAVFLNIKNVIFGNPIIINPIPLVSHGFFPSSPETIGNVGTSFGVYYLIGGYGYSFLMTTIIAIISYSLYFRCIRNVNVIILYFNLFFLTISLLNFFVQYFTLLSIYEMSVFYIFIILFVNINKLTGRLVRSQELTKKIMISSINWKN